MSNYSFRSSKPDNWTLPRPVSDPTLRRMHYGPIQPMKDDAPRGFFAWLRRAA